MTKWGTAPGIARHQRVLSGDAEDAWHEMHGMRTKGLNRAHAAKVAAITTAVVLVAYVIALIVLNILLVHRLTSQADTRLSERLNDARKDVSERSEIRISCRPSRP